MKTLQQIIQRVAENPAQPWALATLVHFVSPAKAARVLSSLRLACVPAQHDSREQSQKSLLMACDGRAAAAAASLREIKLTLRYGLPIPVGLWALAECFLLHRIFSVIGVNRE